MFKIISRKLFINLYFFNIVITKQKHYLVFENLPYYVLIIRLLNEERTNRLITFLSW